ncbi:MAG: NUDIX hydrolase [Lachnoclostridium sp.]|nr:NUDIX hydrolase [Lachnoclostridium sp.]
MKINKLEIPKLIKRELAFHGVILDLYQNYIQFPNGNTSTWDILHHKGAAAMVGVKKNGKIIMVRQYRGAIDNVILEIPAGCLHSKEENMEVCAAREFEEETGYRPEDVRHLVDYLPAPAYSSEKVGIYYSENLTLSKQSLDENEYLQLEEYTLNELTDMIKKGDIVDGKSIAAIYAYQNIKYGT